MAVSAGGLVKTTGGTGIVSLNLKLETPDALMEATAEKFGLDEKAIRRAEVRAINKTVRWLKTQLARQLADNIGVAQKHIKRRLRGSQAKKNRALASVWLGIGGINPMTLGLKGRKTSSGYQVGRFAFAGGFRGYYSGRYVGDGGIYRRVGAARLPIESMDIEVKTQAARTANRLLDRAEPELLKKLRQELNFEMHKKQGTA